MPYRSIETRAIIKTIETLNKRIGERFPGRGLNGVGAELLAAAQDAHARTMHLQLPWLWVRALSAALVAGAALVLGLLATRVQWPSLSQLVGPGHETGVFDMFSGVEAAANVVLLFGAGVFFVLRHEERAKRRQALAALHELRSLAHVIDMHQLTKDPTVMLTPGQRTPSAPQDVMTAFELVRYLDYCAEMLSLTGKIAALYAERVQDSVVIEAVNDIEALTTNFARKIWQKISLVEPSALQRAATL